jgi:hypothetical protein
MGNRHLICIYYEGNFVVAQYVHWGTYPEEKGVALLEFLRQPGILRVLKRGARFVEEVVERDPEYDVENP